MPPRPKPPAPPGPPTLRERLRVNLPDHLPLAPRHPPVPKGPLLFEAGLRTVRVHAIFWTLSVEEDPTVAMIRAASRSRHDLWLGRSQCPPFEGMEAVFQAKWVKGRPVFVWEVVGVG